jgi:hypothetical protein
MSPCRRADGSLAHARRAGRRARRIRVVIRTRGDTEYRERLWSAIAAWHTNRRVDHQRNVPRLQ